MAEKNKIKKITSSVLIIAIMLPIILLSIPHRAQAQFVPVVDTAGNTLLKSITATIGSTATTATKETLSWGQQLLQQVIRFTAKKLLAEITQGTINWINNGFHGSPLFLENPESFFKNIAKSEIKNLVDMIGYDTFRFPFGRQTALNVLDSYKRQFADNAAYSLSKVINDPILLTQYRNNFNYGGWNGFLINTQYPQNNYLGFQGLVQENLASRLEGTLVAPAQKIQNALQQGMGFLSPQECQTNPNYNNSFNEFNKPTFNDSQYEKDHPYDPATGFSGSTAWSAAKVAAKAQFYDPNGTTFCPPYPDGSSGLISTTPGSVAAHKIMASLDIPLQSKILEGALGGKDISDSIGAIIDALLNKIVTTGLNKLKDTANPAPIVDNWSYNGNTLNGNNTTTDLYLPQNVSVEVGETTSTTIFGGSGNYIIQGQPTAAIAAAGISGNTLTVTGRSRGSTAVVVNDTRTPFRSATVIITVTGIGELQSTPAQARTDIDTTLIITISGGTEPYIMTREGPRAPNRAVAVVDFDDKTLLISGVARGNTSVEIKDSSTSNPQTIIIPIVIDGPTDLSIPDISMTTVEPASVFIEGGTKPYAVDSVTDPTVVSARITGTNLDLLTVTGLKGGRTSLVVKDAANKFALVNVVVTDPYDLVGNCIQFGVISSNVTQSSCRTRGGTWGSSEGSGTCTINGAIDNTRTTPGDCQANGGDWGP